MRTLSGKLVGLSMLLAVLSGCVSCPPDWYMEPPKDDAYIYAVGWSGPTHKPSQSREQALTRAMAFLSAQVKVHIKQELVVTQDWDGIQEVSQLTERFIDSKIKGAEIVYEHACFNDGKHVSRDARTKDPGGSTYILVKLAKAGLLE